MHITVVGTGYVGLVTGTCLADTGNHVTCLDIDPGKIALLEGGGCPIYEPGLAALIQRNVTAGRLFFTTDRAAAYTDAEAMLLCVGTPSDDDGRADLQYVLSAAGDVGDAIEARPAAAEGDVPPIVVVKSTVPVGTSTKVRAAISARTSKPFAMASNPEFLKEGDAIRDFVKPDRVVIGVDREDVGVALTDLYRPYVRQGHPILVMDIPSAELVKYASNAMLATKISFINEIANLSEAYGAEISNVRRGMCADTRIGDQFLYPGLGYGGSCFPKDVLACMSMGADIGSPTRLLDAVHEVNQRQRGAFIRKIDGHFSGDVAGKRFAVWGISFKPNTDDIREAPSITIIEWLLAHGATVTAYDPVAMDAARGRLGGRVAFAKTAMEALDAADALVVATEWIEFRHPDFDEVTRRMARHVIFDGRNIWDPRNMQQLGFVYHSVGRQPVTPE